MFIINMTSNMSCWPSITAMCWFDYMMQVGRRELAKSDCTCFDMSHLFTGQFADIRVVVLVLLCHISKAVSMLLLVGKCVFAF